MTLFATAALFLSACGGGDDGESAMTEQNVEQPPPVSGFAHGGKGGKREGSATIAASFPKPKPQPNAPPGAQKAIDAGSRACRGKTPRQVRDEFMAEAEAGGLLNEGQKKMIANIAQYESQARSGPDFVAGQLAAGVYEATLPEALRIAGYQGCVYELAQQLQKEIANAHKG